MAPGTSKRKRGPSERGYSHDEGGGRPSPHRPENMSIANARSSGGRNSRRPSRQDANSVPVTPRPSAQNGSAGAEISRTNTPVPRTGTPVQKPAPVSAPTPPVPDTPKEPPAPYDYEYVTDEVVAAWQESGRQSVLDKAKSGDFVVLSSIFQELVRTSLDARLEPAEAGATVHSIVSNHEDDGELDATALFLNTISLLDEEDAKRTSLLALVAATDIGPEVIRQELDVPLLQSMELVRQSFSTIKTRKATNILYRQANFNLLREDTEGYAKLLTEYFNTAQEASSTNQTRKQSPPADIAENEVQRIMALVGAFDLDVGRVLDITLDISANLLVKAYNFLTRFYRSNPWWPDSDVLDNVKWEESGYVHYPVWAIPGSGRTAPTEEDNEKFYVLREVRDAQFWDRVREVGMKAFFELGARRIVNYDSIAKLLTTEVQPQVDAKGKEYNQDKRNRMNEARKFMRETRMLPPSGNSDAAQILGFKLRYYASAVRDAHESVPENLIALTALLIRIGFISLRDIYGHLFPPDDKMPEEKTRLEKEKAEKEAKERPGTGPNALAMSGALPDDSLPSMRNHRMDKDRNGAATPKQEKKNDEPADVLPPPDNQKLILLKQLLLCGAIPDALFILGRFPWLLEVDISLPPYIHRLARHMLSKMTEETRPLRDRKGLGDTREQLKDKAPKEDGSMTFSSKDRPKVVKWLNIDKFDDKSGDEYRYYFAEWTDTLPVCQSVDDVFNLCNTLLGLLGVKIGQDSQLYSTMLRIAKKSLMEDSSDTNRQRWLDLMRRMLVPALSLSKQNPGAAHGIWELLQLFPLTTRYNLYREWYTGKTSRLPDMVLAFSLNRLEARDILRKVSGDSASKQARNFARISYSSPGVVMTFMLKQLQTYSNMIPALVETTKYLSPFGWDVMSWCIINSLSGQGLERQQADGMLTSPWLAALSHFAAMIFSQYSIISPAPVLRYLASELRAGNTTDLELLKRVLTEMAGIKIDVNFNEEDTQLMAGGEIMRSRVLKKLGDTRHAKKDSARRLVDALTKSNILGQMLVSVAQERQMYAYHESSQNMPLKVLGNNMDQIQEVFAQYLEVLNATLEPTEFEQTIPDVVSLIGDFGLEPALAFTVCKMSIAHRMRESDKGQAKVRSQIEQARKTRAASNEKLPTNGDMEMHDAEAKDVVVNGNGSRNTEDVALIDVEADTTVPNGDLAPSSELAALSPWNTSLEALFEPLRKVTGNLSTRVSIPFFVTFWTHSTCDIYNTSKDYSGEVDKTKDQIAFLKNKHNFMRDPPSSDVWKDTKRSLDSSNISLESLKNELGSQLGIFLKSNTRLKTHERHHWFSWPVGKEELDTRHVELLQECFLPRAMLSTLDARYSFLMLKYMHEENTTGFNTMNILSQLFRKQELISLIFQCTDLEAKHFGLFLNDVLKLLARWHSSKTIFEKEALGSKLAGFLQPYAEGDKDVYLDYETYRRLLTNWHGALNNALQICFESDDYIRCRNGIVVLRSVVDSFPAINFMGQNMLKHLKAMGDGEGRKDLEIMAKSLFGHLSQREKKWVIPQAFRLSDTSKEAKAGSHAPAARQETSQGGDASKLNAGASEFKPSSSGLSNSHKESAAGVEDGEVSDEKQATARVRDTEMEDAPAVKAETEKASEKSASIEDKAMQNHPPGASSVPARPPPSTNGQHRSDSSRPGSALTPGRTPHNLPPRVTEVRLPPNRSLPPPPIQRPVPAPFSGRHDDNFGRLSHDYRPGSRDHSPGRRGGRPRSPPRVGPFRDERPSGRSGRDDSWSTPRRETLSSGRSLQPDSWGRPNGESDSPASQVSHQDRVSRLNNAVPSASSQPPSRPSSSGMTPAESASHSENPERLAWMKEHEAKEAHDRERDGRSQPAGPARPDNRPNGRGPEPSRQANARPEPHAEPTPTGPRNAPAPGRGEMGPPKQQESTYGRLNAPPEPPPAPSVPLGPRAPSGPARGRDRLGYNQPVINTRPNEQSAPTQPAANRPPESQSALRERDQRRGPSSSQPSTPVAESAPIHPDRKAHLANIQTNLPNVNGSRTAQSPSTVAPPSGPRAGRAPVGPVGAPTGPSPINNGPPAGPLLDRSSRNRQRAAINATLQQQQPPNINFRGAATNSRQASVASGTPAAPASPTVQAASSPIELPSSRRNEPGHNEPASRQDGPPSRPSSRAEQRPDLIQKSENSESRENHYSRRRGEEERPDRQRGGRHPSRERRSDDQPPIRPLLPPPTHPEPSAIPSRDDGRDRRGGLSRGDERRGRDERDYRDGLLRDRRSGAERSERPHGTDEPTQRRAPEPAGYFPSQGQGQGPEWNDGRNNRHGPSDSRRGAGGRESGRGEEPRGGKREEERRESGRGPPREDHRKRPHEDVGGLMEGPKRRRSERGPDRR